MSCYAIWEQNISFFSAQSKMCIRDSPRTERLNMMLMESSDSTNWQAAINGAAESDVIIAALGENPTLCGEARQRKGCLLYTSNERGFYSF